jgi:hypothetical protein
MLVLDAQQNQTKGDKLIHFPMLEELISARVSFNAMLFRIAHYLTL